MCYLVSHRTSGTTGQTNSRLLGAIVADTAEEAWRQARSRWPNLDIEVEPLQPPPSAPTRGSDKN
jgi:hypothetical protein